MNDDVLALLDLPALEKIRLARREWLVIISQLHFAQPPGSPDLRLLYAYEEARRALQSIEAEINKRQAAL